MVLTSIFVALIIMIGSPMLSAVPITHHDPLPIERTLARPNYLSPINHPVFATSITRVTDAEINNIQGVVPEYSKRQAFNADGSLLLLRSAQGGVLIFDGNNYQYRTTLSEVGGEDIFWHPTDPDLLYFNLDNALKSYHLKKKTVSTLFTFNEFSFANTRGEGNLSQDGRYYAVVGQQYNEQSGMVTYQALLLLDLSLKKIVARKILPVGLENFDWISVSPKGKYIVVDYADNFNQDFHGVEVYDRSFRRVWQKPLGAGHSDLAFDEKNEEYLIMDVYNADLNVTQFKSFRLRDGAEKTLLTLSPLFDQHISCQNYARPGQCLISTFDYVGLLNDNPPGHQWLPFEDEIFFLKIDGSQRVQRLVHHHSKRFDLQHPDSDTSLYFAEPHATSNRQGNRILFGSNWLQNIGEESALDTYLLDLGN